MLKGKLEYETKLIMTVDLRSTEIRQENLKQSVKVSITKFVIHNKPYL